MSPSRRIGIQAPPARHTPLASGTPPASAVLTAFPREAPLTISSGDQSRTDLGRLLDAFIVGTQGVALHTRINEPDFAKLPHAFRAHLDTALSLRRPWAAWSTDQGYRIAWGDYDPEQSARLRGHVLYIEWCLPPDEHHAGWWHCYPKRPREWTCGRGRPTSSWSPPT